METIIERIYMSEVAKLLNCKSRTAIEWLKKNNVEILSDIGSKKKYVVKNEFLPKYNSQSINRIKQKYGAESITDFFKSGMSFFSQYNQAVSNKKENKDKEYKPTGKKEMEFLHLLNNISEL